MLLPPFLAKLFSNSEYNNLRQNNTLLETTARGLISELRDIQGAVDITTNTDSSAALHYRGTPSKYSTYTTQVTQLGKLYNNTAQWGCMIAKNVIDVRTAFSVGEGIKVKKRDGFEGSAEKELAWVKDFMRFNNLDEEMPQEYAKEAEIEGKVLLRLLGDEEAKNIRVVHTPWRKFNYEITTPDFDFFNYTRAQYTGSNEQGVTFDLSPEFFVYKRFGGISDEVNTTPPKTAFVLREIEDLDKALWDWRKINRLFAAPTPVITCPDEDTAKKVQTWITANNWKIGKMLILGGLDVKFEVVGWKGDGFTTLKAETEALVKTISGTTGVPVHFLGYPELLSNRDTAENLIELIALSTDKERHTWTGTYEELFQKAMVIYNTMANTSLKPMAIDVEIKKTKLTTVEGTPNAPVPNRNNTSTQSE